MKVIVSMLMLCFISIAGYSQVSYYPGYFITNNGDRIECLIKDDDWKTNPKEFYYKYSFGAEKGIKSIEEVKEFGVTAEENRVKFIRALVYLDRSSDDENKLTTDRLSTWTQEELFLEVLLEGDANLYLLQDKNLTRFFFNTISQDSIQQLVYKRYILEEDPQKLVRIMREGSWVIKTDNTFRQQLNLMVNCGGQLAKRLNSLRYTREHLTRYFEAYNEQCNSYSNYYPGYFITNENERIECLIKDNDWFNNPTELTIKASKKAAPDYIDINEIKEFSFKNVSRQEKFIYAEVLVDNSKNEKVNVNEKQLIDWKKKKMLLKVHTEGNANLYSIEDGNSEIFFFNTVMQEQIQQLLYKQYKSNSDNDEEITIEDNTFKKQLHLVVSCWGNKSTMSYRIKNLVYKKSTLMSYFESFNRKCGRNYPLE